MASFAGVDGGAGGERGYFLAGGFFFVVRGFPLLGAANYCCQCVV